MIILKGRGHSNMLVCEEKSCQDDSTQIWASSESRIVDLCDFHYSEAIKP